MRTVSRASARASAMIVARSESEADILCNYPGLAHDDLAARLAGAGDVLRSEKYIRAPRDMLRTVAPGSKAEDILALAVREERIIVVFDKDFAELFAG